MRCECCDHLVGVDPGIALQAEEAQALHQTTDPLTLEIVNVYESSSHFLSFVLKRN